jgi:hypothetical protein
MGNHIGKRFANAPTMIYRVAIAYRIAESIAIESMIP